VLAEQVPPRRKFLTAEAPFERRTRCGCLFKGNEKGEFYHDFRRKTGDLLVIRMMNVMLVIKPW